MTASSTFFEKEFSSLQTKTTGHTEKVTLNSNVNKISNYGVQLNLEFATFVIYFYFFEFRIHFWTAATIEKVVEKHHNQFRTQIAVVADSSESNTERVNPSNVLTQSHSISIAPGIFIVLFILQSMCFYLSKETLACQQCQAPPNSTLSYQAQASRLHYGILQFHIDLGQFTRCKPFYIGPYHITGQCTMT